MRLLARSMIGLGSMTMLLAPVTIAPSPAGAAPRALTSTEYGYSVSISGSIAAVGAPGLDQGQGAVYIFVRSGKRWHFMSTIHDPAGQLQDAFGWSVAIVRTKKGTDLAVGETGFNNIPDLVYVFHQSGKTWRRQATLHDPQNYYGDNFGGSVALTPSTLVVGSSTAYNQEGALYIYTRSGTTWTRRAAFRDPRRNFGDGFGFSVGVSGGTAIATAEGLAYVYSTKTGRHWSRSGTIMNPADPTDNFGISAAISGSTIVVGASGNGGRFSQGAAFVFVRSGARWTVQARLVNPNGITGDEFGNAVSIDGNRALVGAPVNGRGNCGTAYEFLRNGATWKRKLTLVEPRCVPGDQFGASVSVSAGTAIIGAPDENKAYIQPGLP